jgi:PIN domain nuclease of toxin-antitoxin system
VSAITLIEMVWLFGEGGTRPCDSLDVEVAAEVAALGDALRDPADRAIVAIARVRRFRLVTSDQRIIASKLVPVVE